MAEIETVAPNDMQLLQAAQAELAAAQNVFQFAQAHIARIYGLKDGDGVQPDGVIVRKTA